MINEELSEIKKSHGEQCHDIVTRDESNPNHFEQISLKEIMDHDDVPFLSQQNRFKLSIHNFKGEYQDIGKLLRKPTVLDLAKRFIQSNGGGRVHIGGKTYVLINVSREKASTDDEDVVLNLHLKMFKKVGEKSSFIRAPAYIKNLDVHDNLTGDSLMKVDVFITIDNVKNICRMIVYYALLSISTVCENLELINRILSDSPKEISDEDIIYALIPASFSEDNNYKENTLISIVETINQAIEDKSKLTDCEDEMISIGVIPPSIHTLKKYFDQVGNNRISTAKVELIWSQQIIPQI